MTDWPSFKKASDLTGVIFPVSESVILQAARKHGIGRKLGRCIVFSVDDVQRLYEVLPCPSASSVAPNRQTGSSAAPSAESELKKARELVTRGRRKKSKRNARPRSLPSPSTVVALQLPSRAQP